MFKQVNINQIKRNSKNPRYLFDTKALKDLAETIKHQGIIHPIEIDEHNIIICGERRWRASKLAGLKQIPCIIKKGLTSFQKLQRQYIENAQHRDLNIIEKGMAFKNMLKYKRKEFIENRDEKHKSAYHSKGIKDLAEELGETTWIIREAITLTNETKTITDAIHKEEISYSHIIQANKIDNEKIKDKIKAKILNSDFLSRGILKDAVDLINKDESRAKDLLDKSGEDLKLAIERIIDTDIITKQDLKKTVLMQAFPYIEEEYKSFHSTSLVRFIEHLRKIIK